MKLLRLPTVALLWGATSAVAAKHIEFLDT